MPRRLRTRQRDGGDRRPRALRDADDVGADLPRRGLPQAVLLRRRARLLGARLDRRARVRALRRPAEMSPFNLAVTALLAAGVACEVLCALGVLVMRGPFQKLHYASAGTTVGAFFIGAAIVAREALHPGGAVALSRGRPAATHAVPFLFPL